MNYSQKLRSPKWQKKRLEILQRDQFKCCLCGDEETELHVHHLKYTGEPWEAPNDKLQTLCADCHSLTRSTDLDECIKTIKYTDGFSMYIARQQIDGRVLFAFREIPESDFMHVMGFSFNSKAVFDMVEFFKHHRP